MILVPEIRDPMLRYNNTNYTLVNAVTDYAPDAVQGEVTESVIDGTVSMIYKGKRLEGEITVYGLTLANYDAYKAMERHTARLWPLGAGTIPNTNPQKYYPYTDVFIVSVTPFHKNNALYQDACIIKFKSVSYYTLARANDYGGSDQ